jgi:hypothetical protein
MIPSRQEYRMNINRIDLFYMKFIKISIEYINMMNRSHELFYFLNLFYN